jgi:hypothetical protein
MQQPCQNTLESPRFEVTFSNCKAGWMYLSVRAGDQRADNIVLSQVYDPITRLLAWLEALVGGLQSCAFECDDESQTIRIAAEHTPSESMRLTITRPDHEPPVFSVLASRESIVFGFYSALVAFSESDAYVPAEWEGDVDWNDPEVAMQPIDGLPWRQLRSQTVEAWLALPSDRKPYVFNHWQRWLKVHQYR